MTELITNDLKEINLEFNKPLTDILEKAKCKECKQPFSKDDIKEKNFELWFDKTEDSEWEKATYADNIGNEANGENLQGWLKVKVVRITHKPYERKHDEEKFYFECPDTEKCADCEKPFKEVEMKKGIYKDEGNEENNLYCSPCFDKKFGEYLKERSKRKKLKPEQKEVMRIIQKALSEHLQSNYHSGGHDYSKCKGSECEGYKETLESYGYERE